LIAVSLTLSRPVAAAPLDAHGATPGAGLAEFGAKSRKNPQQLWITQ
jgi:hypothetical protein